MKIDLHCHSKYSKRPTLWVMQKLGCPESFTEPTKLYALAREKGMSAVTITDHNVIDGALEIAHLPDTFIGCEYTTYFPEDHCKVHVLVYGLTEAQHEDITRARENIHDLVTYLTEAALPHVCAHPLFWVNDRLTVEHIEQLALLFKNWELNGDHDQAMNAAVMTIIDGLREADIERLANKHGIVPAGPEPWRKNIAGGSDDHGSLNLARTYTEVLDASNLDEFWQGIGQGLARVRTRPVTPKTFARNIYGIGYQFYKNRLSLDRHVNKDISLRFMDRSLTAHLADTAEPFLSRLQLRFAEQRRARTSVNDSHSFLELLRIEAEGKIRQDPQFMSIMRDGFAQGSDPDQQWFEFLNEVSNRLLAHFGRRLLERVLGARFIDLFHSLGSAGALYFLLAPYFLAFSIFARERRWTREVLDHFGQHWERVPASRAKTRVAHFSDTLHDVNGVARTLRKQLATAREMRKDYSLIACFGEKQRFERGICQFRPVDTYQLPEYPELSLRVPPFLQMLNHCYEEGYTHLHVSTPGPVGLAALGIARILQLPISGTYHTSFPQYAKALTEDGYVEDSVWRYMLWFYEQLDAVYVPSKATGEELVAKGFSAHKIRLYPRGVDIERFRPDKRMPVYQEKYGLEHDAQTLLYVGRISKEKNLHDLARTYRAFVEQGGAAHLVIAGDGPYREEMERELASTPALFTGYLEGDALATLYASSDMLVFPSTTDTFGNVVLEAQASGIPVIVTDKGGPCENIIPDKTGLVVDMSRPEALLHAIGTLIYDVERRRAMGAAARAYMEKRGFRQAFETLWEMYTSETSAPRNTSELELLAKTLNPAAAVGL